MTKTAERTNWKRVVEHRQTLLGLHDEDKDVKHLMAMDCIDHLGERTDGYESILLFAQKSGIKRVVDIGCAYGFQSEIFIDSGVTYVGVDEGVNGEFWNNEQFTYVQAHYPAKLPLEKGDLAVSVLCLGWNVYLYEKEKTFHEQFEALSRDFKHALLYIPHERVADIGKYFSKSEKISEGLFYFSN